MAENETIREIRETRKTISAKFGHDPKRLVAHYKEKQKVISAMEASNNQRSPNEASRNPG